MSGKKNHWAGRSLDQIKAKFEQRIRLLNVRLKQAITENAPMRDIHDIRYELSAAERRLKLITEKVSIGKVASND